MHEKRSRRRILYLTFDGVLQPLGRSQVVRLLEGLSERRGYSYTLISLEREADLADAKRAQALEAGLLRQGIQWIKLPFQTGGSRAALANITRVFRAARSVVERESIELIHARSYLPALIARRLHHRRGVSYLFDMRGYWIDELAAERRWITNRAAYTIGKRMERKLIGDASAIVTLTELQADDVRGGKFSKIKGKPIVAIPTCADYDEFNLDSPPSLDVVSEEITRRLQNKLVLGLVGSLNASYRFDESIRLFRYALDERPDAHLLCLTGQVEQLRQLLIEHKIPETVYTIATVKHDEIVAWLRLMRWGVLLLHAGFSKRGSMPTKLAEFFASGVRPVQFGCNEEVSRWVEVAGSGIVLRDLSDDELRATAKRIATEPLDATQVREARERTRLHFSLESGVKRYAQLLDDLFAAQR